jgi:hypothetical protein
MEHRDQYSFSEALENKRHNTPSLKLWGINSRGQWAKDKK